MTKILHRLSAAAGALALLVLGAVLGTVALAHADASAPSGITSKYITNAYYALQEAYLTAAGGFKVTPVNGSGTAIGTAASPLYVSPATSPLVQPVSDNAGSLTVDGTVSVTGGNAFSVAAADLTTPVGASNCAANGTTVVSLSAGTYDFTGSDELVFLCGTDDGGSGTDCATLGSKFHPGVTRRLKVPAITGYCRSAGATGDINATAVSAQ